MTVSIVIPESGFKKFIIELADQHNVVYVRTGFDELADVFTELSGDEVRPDNIQDLAVALRREGVISNKEMLSLIHGYLKEQMQDIYVFLDFDGVTHPVSANGDYFREESLEALCSAFEELNVKVVIASTWRLDKTFEELVSSLGKLGQYVAGITPEINEPFRKYIRQAEVEAYLKSNGLDSKVWVAIDDTPAFYRETAPIYIVDGSKGFTENDISPFLSYMNEQLNGRRASE